MPGLSDTVRRLAAIRAATAAPRSQAPGRLGDFAFAPNPGALKARTYLPAGLKPNAPLVVVLHGCTQSAAGYDAGSGWSTLADANGFALLFPQQARSNNGNLCFNWYEPGDTGRDGGEAASIRAMVAALVAAHRLDGKRVFVTGLSAGGAMTAALLAAYPEVFAGGAVIAGLPYGVATSVPEAFERMRGSGLPDAAALQAGLRGASTHSGTWPTLSVWHGSADATVDVANADALVDQWRGVHGLAAKPDRSDRIDGQQRRVWRDARGRDAVTSVTIAGLGHGTPIDAADGIGIAAPYMLDARISSTRHIAAAWGIAPPVEQRAARPARTPPPPPPRSRPAVAHGVAKVIEDALRSAGLVR